jgi:hypothetical protein
VATLGRGACLDTVSPLGTNPFRGGQLVEHLQLLTLVSAELLFLVSRSQDIIAICKSTKQRTAGENARVGAGLGRSLALEFVVFVPASAALVILMSPLFLGRLSATLDSSGVHAMLGVVSYGFPFVGIKRIAVAMALRAIREFASIATEPVKAEIPPVKAEIRVEEEKA